MEICELMFINCVKLSKVLGVSRHQAGFILKYFEREGMIKLYGSAARRHNYEVMDGCSLQKAVEAISADQMNAELKQFRVDVCRGLVPRASAAGA